MPLMMNENEMWQVTVDNRRPLVYSRRSDAFAVFRQKESFIGTCFKSVELERVDARDVNPADIVR